MRILIMVLALGAGVLHASPATAAAPQPGTCWNLTESQRMQATLPAAQVVDCAVKHTAELLAVVRAKGLTPSDAYQRCQQQAAGYLGSRPTAGLTAGANALPRTAQLSAYVSRNGKKAYCVGFNTASNGGVAPRKASVVGTGGTPRVCFNDRTWVRQKCSARRSVAMTHVAWLSDSPSQKYPGDRRAAALAAHRCFDLAKSAGLLAEAWYVPGSTAWQIGNRYAYCRLIPDETDTGWQPLY